MKELLIKEYKKKLDSAIDRVYQLKPGASKTQQYTRACVNRDRYKEFIIKLEGLK